MRKILRQLTVALAVTALPWAASAQTITLSAGGDFVAACNTFDAAGTNYHQDPDTNSNFYDDNVIIFDASCDNQTFTGSGNFTGLEEPIKIQVATDVDVSIQLDDAKTGNPQARRGWQMGTNSFRDGTGAAALNPKDTGVPFILDGRGGSITVTSPPGTNNAIALEMGAASNMQFYNVTFLGFDAVNGTETDPTRTLLAMGFWGNDPMNLLFDGCVFDCALKATHAVGITGANTDIRRATFRNCVFKDQTATPMPFKDTANHWMTENESSYGLVAIKNKCEINFENCTFSNARYGIDICSWIGTPGDGNPPNPGYPQTINITGCTFSNMSQGAIWVQPYDTLPTGGPAALALNIANSFIYNNGDGTKAQIGIDTANQTATAATYTANVNFSTIIDSTTAGSITADPGTSTLVGAVAASASATSGQAIINVNNSILDGRTGVTKLDAATSTGDYNVLATTNGASVGAGSVTTNPTFVGSASAGDLAFLAGAGATAANLHLKDLTSAGVDLIPAAAADAAIPLVTKDVDGENRRMGTNADAGADEVLQVIPTAVKKGWEQMQ